MFNFRSQITQKVLQYFFVNPEAKKYVNELARILQVDAGNLDRKLKELEKNGVLLSEMLGKQKYYELNNHYPFLQELQKIFESQYGLVQKLKELLSSVQGVQEAYIFGSFAKKTFQTQSDVDMLMIGNHSMREVQKIVIDLQEQIQREINIVHLSPTEFQLKQANNDPFLDNIFKNPLIRLI